MKSCYADKDLNISAEDFQEPENLSINVDCSIVVDDKTVVDDSDDTPDDLDF